MIRKLIAKFNRLKDERVAPVRHKRAVPIKLSFEANKNMGRLDTTPKVVFISGETADLSHTGIGFIVSSIRIKENYLVGSERVLNAELDLPNGKISMKIVGKRYEQIGGHDTTARYLVGASICEMTDENREAYDAFLRYGDRKEKATRSRRFGIDES